MKNLKRIIMFLCLVIVFFPRTAMGQPDYKLVVTNYEHEVQGDDGICWSYVRFHITEKEIGQREVRQIDGAGNLSGHTTHYESYVAIPLTAEATGFMIEIFARDADSDGGFSGRDCNDGDNGIVDAHNWINNLSISTCTAHTFSGNYPHIDGKFLDDNDGVQINRVAFTYRFLPVHTLIAENINGEQNTLLPADDKITLLAKKDYPENFYIYQWRLEEENNDETAWRTIAANLHDQQYPHRLTVSAKDLLGDSYIGRVGKNIQIRVASCPENGVYQAASGTVSLTVIPSAPHITAVTPATPRCYGEFNGKLTIQFDRDLFADERLYISVKDDEFSESATRKITSGNEAVIENLPAGDYNISLIGIYTYGAGVNDTINTFTQGENHTKAATVAERPAIGLSLTQNAVHCKNGMDGKVNLTVSGGNDVYTAYLLNGAATDTLNRMSVASGTHTFSELYQGDYHVYVKDGNGCDYDENNAKVQKPMTVTQPADTVGIHVIGFNEAHGYGRATGWAEVGVRGGSEGYDFTWTKQTPPMDMPATSGTDKPIGGNDSILSNLYTGYYKVKVTDRNNIDTISLVFRLVEPDTLIAVTVALKQVLCDGDNTGKAEVTVTGGTPPYTYQWTTDNNDTTTTVENLPRNIYTVFVKMPPL